MGMPMDPQEELESVVRNGEVWADLISLFPLRPPRGELKQQPELVSEWVSQWINKRFGSNIIVQKFCEGLMKEAF